ncbi:MAG TPA: sodium-dependent transporter [Steroidobacteraceae bacterium]|nr:sodium-dependent transporter [Steroidobacteraceae bacterium]
MSAAELEIAARDAAVAPTNARARWSSRISFVLAAAGSAVGLGSIWKFPYITGVNGGSWFVLVYLACIVLVAIPIMIAEILIGRTAQRSTVGAFRALSGRGRLWTGVGWLGLIAAFLILSYYFVVSGWTLHYTWLALSGQLVAADTAGFQRIFADVYASPSINLFWFLVFIAVTAAVVIGGVQKGIERCCRALVPLLLLIMLAMLVDAAQGPGFTRGMQFVFGVQGSVTAAGVLEALGHSFFTLSLGMGAMITYGSYLSRKDDAVASASMVAGLDTLISLLACMTIFPIIFAFGLDAAAGPGLVFVSLPVAFAQMPGGQWWATSFFVLLAIAALSSTISLFEVLVSHLVDERRMTRLRACLWSAGALALAGIPAALSGGTRMFGIAVQSATAGLFNGSGKNWFDFVDYVSSNWLLPLSGLGIAAFFAWRVGAQAREAAFRSGTRFGKLYWSWVWLLRYLVPPAVVAVFLKATGSI